MRTDSIHQVLKEGTQDLHDQIEGSSLMHRLMQTDLTKHEYVLFLKKNLEFYQAAEDQLQAIPGLLAALPDLAERLKSSSLKKDLQSFDESFHLDAAPPKVELKNLSEAFGLLYVLEGSSLGGQLIKKKLAQQDFINDQNLHFFSHYGADVGRRWRNFLGSLEKNQADQKINADAVLSKARETFLALSRTFKI